MDEPKDVGFKKTAEAETQYTTGAQRDNRLGKGAYRWVPWDAMRCVSTIYERGNLGRSKTGDGHDRNWEWGIPIIDFCESAINHLTAYIAGDRSEAHLWQAGWNVLNAIQTAIWVYTGARPKELNKLPDHRTVGWTPNDEPPSPLAPMEIERAKFLGIIPKDK